MHDDFELVSGCLEGNKDAWDAFVERFAKLIHWSIRRILEKTSLAARFDVHEEIFQEVFEKLIRRDELARLRNVETIRKYLSLMACRMASDKLKYFSRKDFRDVSLDEPVFGDTGEPERPLAGEGNGGLDDPASETARKERRGVIEEVLKGLSPKERACIEFCCFDGRSHNEISLILGLSQDTVSTVIRRAKEKLKRGLLDRGIHDY